MPDNEHLNWLEINVPALTNNINYIRSLTNENAEIAALLKANAYGHGIDLMAALFHKQGINTFMVHSFSEAWNLRKYKKKRIIILGPLSQSETFEAVKKGFEFVVYTTQQLMILKNINTRQKETPKIHIKIETGTNRQGIALKDIPEFISLLKKIKYDLKGLSTHFANIEDTSDKFFYKKQLNTFNKAREIFKTHKIKPEQYHVACSAAVVMYPETHFDLIRPGIALYGYSSSKEMSYAFALDKKLTPILSWKTKIAQIKTVPKGEGIGYGLTFTTTRKSKIGVLPVGYYDGYDRKLSNIASVIVNNNLAPVRGRICMNLMMIDLTDLKEVREGDTVTLLGSSKYYNINADTLSELSQTISYETLARINPLIPRVVINE